MTRTKNTIFITAYLLLVLAVWLFLSLLPRPEIVPLAPQAGTADLSSADFSGTVYWVPDGCWESYPEALLIPADFVGANPPQAVPVNSVDFSAVQYATHRLQLRLPPGEIYALTIESADYAMRLFIDDAEAGLVGIPGAAEESNVPRTLTQSYYFQPAGDVTTLLMQASNWVHRDGAYPSGFHIGSGGNMEVHNRHVLILTYFITGTLVTAFLYHLGLFALNRRRTVTLLFALCCLLLAVMAGRMHQLFPEYNWFIAFRVEYIVHFLTFAALCRFLEMLFPRLHSRWVTRPYYALAGLYTLTTFVFSTKVYSSLLIGFDLVSVGIIGYTLVRLAMQMKERKAQNALAFTGILAVCLLGVYDLLLRNQIVFWGHIAGQEFATPIAMCFFVFCYAMVVALEYADTERSLTDERRMVESLSVSNAALDRISQMRSDIIATISHESRTPLAVLASYAGLVSMELKAKGVDEQIAADLDTVAFEAKRVANLIDGMRKLSQQNEIRAERSVLDIGELIRQTARLYEPIVGRGDVKLAAELRGESFPVFGNAEELTQVIFNLLQNAKNHTGRGGISATVKTENGEVSVAIADTGTGIGPELLPRVFERGVAGENGGTGIGLAICKEVIESHGGRITITSEPDQGTAVTFTLPEYTDGDGESHAE